MCVRKEALALLFLGANSETCLLSLMFEGIYISFLLLNAAQAVASHRNKHNTAITTKMEIKSLSTSHIFHYGHM